MFVVRAIATITHDCSVLRLSLMRVPKLGVTFLEVPIIRTFVLWGLNWGPPILGNSLMRAPG